MTTKELLQSALVTLRHQFPSPFQLLPDPLDIPEPDHEPGAIAFLEDCIDRCENDALKGNYARELNALYKTENGPESGAAFNNATLSLRCRALLSAMKLLT